MATKQKAAFIYICALVLLIPVLIVPGIDEFALLPRLLAYLPLSFALSIYILFAPGQVHQTPRSITTWLLAFWGILALSALWAVNPVRSVYDLAKHVPAFAMFVLLARHLNKSDIPTVLTCHAAIGSLVSVLGILEYFGLSPVNIPSTGRPSATFAFRNLAAAYLCTAIPLSWLLGFQPGPAWRRHLGALTGGGMLLFLLYTRARASWFGLSVGLMAAFMVWSVAYIRRGGPVSIGSLVRRAAHPVVYVAVIAVALGLLPDRLSEQHTQRFDEKKSSMVTALASITREGGDRGRFKMWESTLDLIRDHPLLGVGLGNWEYIYPPYDNGVQIQATSRPHRPHNDVLWIWSETGTLGLLILLALLYAIARKVYASLLVATNELETLTILATTTTMVAFFGVGMFSFPFERVPPEFMFWLAASILVVTTRSTRSVKWVARPSDYLLPAVLLAALVVSIRHTQFDRYYAKAHVAYLHKDYQTAADLAEQALKYGPFDHQAYLMVGEGAYHRGKWDQSEAAYRKALGYHPNFSNAYNGLGLAEYGRGNYAEALAYYDRTLEGVPHHHIALHNKGLVFEALGELDSAKAVYNRAVKTDHGAPLINLGAIYRKEGKVDSAIATYLRATALPVPSPEGWFNLGRIYIEQKDFASAGEAYFEFLRHWNKEDSVAVAARSGLAQSYSGFGVQMESRGQIDSARVAYQRALEIDPGEYLNWFNLGNVLRKQSKLEEAAQAYQKAISINDSHVDSYSNLGMTYRDLGRDEEALRLYTVAKTLSPDNAILNYNLGQTLMALGRHAESEEPLNAFRRNWAGDPVLVHYYMGNAYAQGGRYPEARSEYERFLAEWRGDSGIRQSAQRILDSITSESEP